jgi:hypothetical protein
MGSRNVVRVIVAVVVVLVAAVLELRVFEGTAQAIIGRPLTPMSYAGVARRTTRRAVVYGAAAAPLYW